MKVFKRSVVSIVVIFLILVVSAPVIYASTTNAPKIVTGTERLIKDAMKWLLILIPVTGSLMIAYHQHMKKWAQDSGDIAMRDKRSKNIMIATIIAFSASGLITALLSYYE